MPWFSNSSLFDGISNFYVGSLNIVSQNILVSRLPMHFCSVCFQFITSSCLFQQPHLRCILNFRFVVLVKEFLISVYGLKKVKVCDFLQEGGGIKKTHLTPSLPHAQYHVLAGELPERWPLEPWMRSFSRRSSPRRLGLGGTASGMDSGSVQIHNGGDTYTQYLQQKSTST